MVFNSNSCFPGWPRMATLCWELPTKKNKKKALTFFFFFFFCFLFGKLPAQCGHPGPSWPWNHHFHMKCIVFIDFYCFFNLFQWKTINILHFLYFFKFFLFFHMNSICLIDFFSIWIFINVLN